MSQKLQIVSDIVPLALFFTFYKLYDLATATAALVLATIVIVAYGRYKTGKFAMMPLVSAIVVSFFGVLTIYSHNEIFIKLKPTIINLIFAAILFAGYFRGKGLLKYVFKKSIEMSEEAWKIFSVRWAFFFVFLAGLNEIIWRNFSTDFWVNFKVFGLISLTLVFMISQLPFMQRNAKLS